VLTKIREALGHTEFGKKTVTVEFIVGKKSPIRDTIECLTPFLREKNLAWDGLSPFLRVRQELFEIDWRFGQLGDKGIFAAMDKAGVLEHRAPGVARIKQAMSTPPSAGRAHLRGACVRRFAADTRRYSCDWDIVVDRKSNRMLDLSDPFATQENWRDIPTPTRDHDSLRELFMTRMRNRAERTPEGHQVGDRVVLGRHEVVEGERNWHRNMAQYAGQEATIMAIGGLDSSGCCLVRVDLDGGRFAWRSRDLRPAPR
jgi:hypothetical protein